MMRFALSTYLLLASAMAQAQSTPASRVADIAWPDDLAISAAAGSTKGLGEVGGTLLPVLVPKPMLGADVSFAGDQLSYTVSAERDGRWLTVSGTRVAIDVPGGIPATDKAADAAAPARGSVSGRIAAEDRVASAGMTQFGAAYTVTIECVRPADHACDTNQLAQDYLGALELVGGGKATPTQQPARFTADGPDMIAATALPAGWRDAPGKLVRVGAVSSGSGVTSATLFAPGMRFPVEARPAYLNSQVYSIGGSEGPQTGGWNDPRNYQYPWHDNFCERRARKTASCPGGLGHQGQDIRPAGPQKDHYYAVAAEDGYISKVGSWMTVLTGASGTRYNYLHLSKASLAALGIRPGSKLRQGERIGLISNEFGGTPTSVHLHFEIMQNVNGKGMVHVPPYTSLVKAYEGM